MTEIKLLVNTNINDLGVQLLLPVTGGPGVPLPRGPLLLKSESGTHLLVVLHVLLGGRHKG